MKKQNKKNNKKSDYKFAKLSLIVLIIGIIIRFYLASIHHVSGDACWQLSNARFIGENGRIPLFEQFGRDEPFWSPPLFHIIAAFVYALFGNFEIGVAEFAIKMLSPFFGSATLILFFFIAKRLFNTKIAFYSLIFIAFMPLSVDYSVLGYIDGTVSFLALLSVYLAIRNRIILSGITAGLAALAKYNGFFILPVLIYIIYLNNKSGNKKITGNILRPIIVLCIISAAIGSLWFIRNWIYLGNPVWPFLNNIFNGYKSEAFVSSGTGSIGVSNILKINAIYLDIFGIPNGNINLLSFLNLPFIELLFLVWISGTFVFLIPLFIGISSKKLEHKKLLFIWIASFIALILIYVANASWSVARLLLPTLPAFALIWAHGLDRIKVNIRKIYLVVIILIAAGFVFTSGIKFHIAAQQWDFYKEDFNWVKLNTDKNSIFMTGSQCIAYNIGRETANPAAMNLNNADYIFVNQNFKIDSTSRINSALLNNIKRRGNLVYSNKKTMTEIYETKNNKIIKSN